VLRSTDRIPVNQDSLQNAWQGSWPAIVRIIILEIVLLLALAGAFVCYLSWSSEAAVSDFMAASRSFQAVHSPCDRSA
jgi:hypothetical protein